ncbi:Protein F46C5.2 [Dirofilaria immitis]|nr:Protein F46C5.2 [Dirofilaria immitis]
MLLQNAVSFLGLTDDFELDLELPSVTCRQCIQLWHILARDSHSTCGPNSRTCTGNYMAGCLTLTDWQLTDLTFSRQRAELLAIRVGASLLCEDSVNQTTCICNRKNKCNDIHARTPFSTYSAPLFNGIINFDAIITKIDPYYNDMIRSKQASKHYTADTAIRAISLQAVWVKFYYNYIMHHTSSTVYGFIFSLKN